MEAAYAILLIMDNRAVNPVLDLVSTGVENAWTLVSLINYCYRIVFA